MGWVVIRTDVSEQLLGRDRCLKYLIESGLCHLLLEGGKISIVESSKKTAAAIRGRMDGERGKRETGEKKKEGEGE